MANHMPIEKRIAKNYIKEIFMAEFDSIRSGTRSDSYVNIDSGLRAHMNKVYGLMAVAMVITGAVAWSIGTSPQLVSALFSNSIISLIVCVFPSKL